MFSVFDPNFVQNNIIFEYGGSIFLSFSIFFFLPSWRLGTMWVCDGPPPRCSASCPGLCGDTIRSLNQDMARAARCSPRSRLFPCTPGRASLALAPFARSEGSMTWGMAMVGTWHQRCCCCGRARGACAFYICWVARLRLPTRFAYRKCVIISLPCPQGMVSICEQPSFVWFSLLRPILGGN